MAIDKDLLNPGETIVVSTRTHPKALILPILALVVLLAIGVAVMTVIDQEIVTLVIWAVVAIGIVWFVLRPFLAWFTSTYTITSQRLITRHGVMTRKGHDIALSRISDVSYERDIIDRLLGCGTLLISDASPNPPARLPDIPGVEDTQKKLAQLVQELHSPRSDEGV